MSIQSEALTAGSIIEGRYQISSLLGQGGMSRVYLATDLRLNVRVALKENLQTEPQAKEQFRREAQILAHLSHPSLPRVMDHFDESVTGKQYLVMDYVEGEDLNMMVKRVGRLPEATAVNWIQQILSAVEYLHSQQPPVIHRDIKPSNIKITPSGKAVLVDFGIAKTYEASGATVTGARAATPGYAPPEQYGLRTDQRSDVYALGATLYTLLTGLVPPESTLRISNLAVITPPRQIVPDISPQVEMAMLSALDVDTQRRWQSATQFRSALAPGAAASVEPGGSTRPSAPRPPVSQPGAAPAMDLTARTPLPPTYSPYGGASADQIGRPVSLPPPPRKERKTNFWIWGASGFLLAVGVLVAALFVIPPMRAQQSVVIVPGPTQVPILSPSQTAVPVAPTLTSTDVVVALADTETPQPPTETATVTASVPVPTDTPQAPTATALPPTAVPTRATNTRVPPTAIPATPTPKGPATISVVKIRLDPADTRRNQQVTYYVTFRNTFTTPQQRTWSVWVYLQDKPRNRFWGMEPASTVTLPVGDSEWASSPTMCFCGPGGALNYTVYVKYIAGDGAASPVPDLNGGSSALGFTVNP